MLQSSYTGAASHCSAAPLLAHPTSAASGGLTLAHCRLQHFRPGTLSLAIAENDDEDRLRLQQSYRNTEFLITTGDGQQLTGTASRYSWRQAADMAAQLLALSPAHVRRSAGRPARHALLCAGCHISCLLRGGACLPARLQRLSSRNPNRGSVASGQPQAHAHDMCARRSRTSTRPGRAEPGLWQGPERL